MSEIVFKHLADRQKQMYTRQRKTLNYTKTGTNRDWQEKAGIETHTPRQRWTEIYTHRHTGLDAHS